tara:strand:+ start:180 stop:419 length:240 start_codon:yes stop_codon:yes gene_type:complete
MSKVVITLGDSPADCSIEVDGLPVQGVTNISASVDLENGPQVSYALQNEIVEHVEFNPVIDEESPIGQAIKENEAKANG